MAWTGKAEVEMKGADKHSTCGSMLSTSLRSPGQVYAPLAGVPDAQVYSQPTYPILFLTGPQTQTQASAGWASSQVPLTPTAQSLS